MRRGVEEIRDAYRDERVARDYIDERFRQPLGRLLHDRQADALRQAVARHQPRAILEIAPGPARLTTEVAAVYRGQATVLDASRQMLDEARRRLSSAQVSSSFRFVNGDAYALPFRGPFDLVYSFRLIRHFDTADRQRLYKSIRRVLAPNGLLMFDAVNRVVSEPLRRQNPGEYQHFDGLVSPEELVAELDAAGLTVVELRPVQHRFPLLARIQHLVAPRSTAIARVLMEAVDRSGGEPLEWVVTCRPKPARA